MVNPYCFPRRSLASHWLQLKCALVADIWIMQLKNAWAMQSSPPSSPTPNAFPVRQSDEIYYPAPILTSPECLISLGQFDKPGSEGEYCRDPKAGIRPGQRQGDNAQVSALGQALGGPFEIKQLDLEPACPFSFSKRNASPFGLDTMNTTLITDPSPDIVIAIGRRAAPVSRWIKRRSGGPVLPRCRDHGPQ